MKFLLTSNSTVALNHLDEFFDKTKGLKCLLVPYAREIESVDELKNPFLNLGINVSILDENYLFDEKIDFIFVRGGNVTRLLHFLKKFKQFEKIKQMIEENILYVGCSAGVIIVGGDTKYTLKSEPYLADLEKLFGKNAFFGFNLVHKFIFVHASLYRLCREYEMENEDDIFITKDDDCYPAYLEEKATINPSEFIEIKNNGAYIFDGKSEKIIEDDWSKLKIK